MVDFQSFQFELNHCSWCGMCQGPYQWSKMRSDPQTEEGEGSRRKF